MTLKLVLCLAVFFAIVFGAECVQAGFNCGCRPPPTPPSSLPTVPLMLDNCGPSPCPLPPINAPPVQTCPVNKGLVALPACAPPPKTIANTCHCVKTVVKPQVVQQLITVPSVQRYIQTTHQPVVEHIHYQGIPINCPPYSPEVPPPTCSTSLPCSPTLTPFAATISKPQTLSCFADATAKSALPTQPALHPSFMALLSLAARPNTPVLPACLPLRSCLPAPRPAAIIPASVSLPPCLLSLLSKLL